MVDTQSTSGAVAARISVHEPGRLAALRRLNLLDTPRTASFDRVTRQASQALVVPIVLVSLVDERRQWFKSRVGLAATETPRNVSFCAHAVYECRPLIVNDASLDSRFADNELVTGPPHIRAYAGIPLYTEDGYAIGTLCAIDVVPREFSDEDIDVLRDFACMIEDFVHAQEVAARMRRSVEVANERERTYRDTFDMAAVGLLHTDLQGRFLRMNASACRLMGRAHHDLANASLGDVTHSADAPAATQMLREIGAGRVESGCMEQRFVRADGSLAGLGLGVTLKRTASGDPEYLIASLHPLAS